MEFEAAIKYGPHAVRTYVPAHWQTKMTQAALDPEALARLCYAFFGQRSGGYYTTVMRDGAQYSAGCGRVFIAGNGWELCMYSDRALFNAGVAECVAAAKSGDELAMCNWTAKFHRAVVAKPKHASDRVRDLTSMREPQPGRWRAQ